MPVLLRQFSGYSLGPGAQQGLSDAVASSCHQRQPQVPQRTQHRPEHQDRCARHQRQLSLPPIRRIQSPRVSAVLPEEPLRQEPEASSERQQPGGDRGACGLSLG